MMTRCLWARRDRVAAMLLASVGLFGCAHTAEHDKAEAEARATGQYKVRLTNEREKILGECQYLMAIQPDLDPVKIPAPSELPEYFRVKAVLAGADTVVIDGRVGEAYICGPSPLNPDGTLRTLATPSK